MLYIHRLQLHSPDPHRSGEMAPCRHSLTENWAPGRLQNLHTHTHSSTSTTKRHSDHILEKWPSLWGVVTFPVSLNDCHLAQGMENLWTGLGTWGPADRMLDLLVF